MNTYQELGVTSFTVGVGWQGDLLRTHLEESYPNLSIEIVDVPDYESGPLTTLVTLLETVEDDSVIVGPVDILMDKNLISRAWTKYQDKKPPEDIILLTDASVEKGTKVFLTPDSRVAGLGIPVADHDSMVRSAMLMIIRSDAYGRFIEASRNGTKKVSDALNHLIESSTTVGFLQIEETWFDIDTVDDLLEANQYFLYHLRESANAVIHIHPNDNMEFGEALKLPSNVSIDRDVTLRGPVLIQRNCEISQNTQIGPNVVLGKGTIIGAGCKISNAIFFQDVRLSRNMNVNSAVAYDSEFLYSEG